MYSYKFGCPAVQIETAQAEFRRSKEINGNEACSACFMAMKPVPLVLKLGILGG